MASQHNEQTPFQCWKCGQRVPIKETHNMRCPECDVEHKKELRERYEDKPLTNLET